MPLGAVDAFIRYDLPQHVMFSILINYGQDEKWERAMIIKSLTDVELWVSLDIPRGRVPMNSSKVPGKPIS
jgi:hypothetical protein